MIKVRVLYENYGTQKPLKGARVAVGFHGFIGTMSSAQFTDSDGCAGFDHKHTGSFSVYVNGSKYGPYSASGSANITVSVDL